MKTRVAGVSVVNLVGYPGVVISEFFIGVRLSFLFVEFFVISDTMVVDRSTDFASVVATICLARIACSKKNEKHKDIAYKQTHPC